MTKSNRPPLPYPVVDYIPEYIRDQMPRLYSAKDWVNAKKRVEVQFADIRLQQKMLKQKKFEPKSNATDLEVATLRQQFEDKNRTALYKLLKAEQSKRLQLALFDEWKNLNFPEGIPSEAYREKADELLEETGIADNRFIKRLRAKLRFTAESTAEVIEILLNPNPELSPAEVEKLQEMREALLKIDERYSE